MDQTDTSWNPHAKQEFFKVALRSVFSLKVSEIRKEVNLNIAETVEETNQMEDLKISIVKNVPTDPDSQSKISIVDNAISALKIKLSQLRLDLSNRLAFKSRVKWFEYGEKSNKLFLNLLKCKQSQKLISYIKNGDTSYVGAQVIHGIREFYSNLYSAKIRQKPVNDNFYEHCPKLTSEQSLR
jgi:flavodoxin